jgi:hypothetical protein
MDQAAVSKHSRDPVPSYRDELNFAEFPLGALGDHVPKGQKTLEFTDTIFDSGQKKPVTRKLTISASDKYGLPTALDDEVILGLLQLSHRLGFESPELHFSRYELIKLLGWRVESKSYDRIGESLKRWVGVTLYYERAWWSKDEQCWVDKSFHILEQVDLFDRERRDRHRQTNPDDPNGGLSSVVWNPVVFNSFKSGYLKQLDLELYKRLESRVAKRIYRFLDKRFYHRPRHEFDLREFACEHIGLSKVYHNSNLKRKMKAGIEELERVGFLEPMADRERFVCSRRGVWSVVFVKRGTKEKHPEPEAGETASALERLGMTPAVARDLASRFEAARIEEKVALTEWLVARKDKRVGRNPAGYLYSAIVKDFAPPPDFVDSIRKREARGPGVIATRRDPTSPEPKGDREAIDRYWAGLTPMERVALEGEALKLTDKFLADQYRDGKEGGGVLFRAVRQTILDQHVRRLLKAAAQAT